MRAFKPILLRFKALALISWQQKTEKNIVVVNNHYSFCLYFKQIKP